MTVEYMKRQIRFQTHRNLNVYMLKMWGVILLYTCVHQVLNDVIGSVL
jgi:hypothetical protein